MKCLLALLILFSISIGLNAVGEENSNTRQVDGRCERQLVGSQFWDLTQSDEGIAQEFQRSGIAGAQRMQLSAPLAIVNIILGEEVFFRKGARSEKLAELVKVVKDATLALNIPPKSFLRYASPDTVAELWKMSLRRHQGAGFEVEKIGINGPLKLENLSRSDAKNVKIIAQIHVNDMPIEENAVSDSSGQPSYVIIEDMIERNGKVFAWIRDPRQSSYWAQLVPFKSQNMSHSGFRLLPAKLSGNSPFYLEPENTITVLTAVLRAHKIAE